MGVISPFQRSVRTEQRESGSRIWTQPNPARLLTRPRDRSRRLFSGLGTAAPSCSPTLAISFERPTYRLGRCRIFATNRVPRSVVRGTKTESLFSEAHSRDFGKFLLPVE